MLGLSLMNFCQMNKVLTHIEPKLVVFQGLWRDLGLCLGASGHHIGASWLHIGCLMAMLAQSWGILGVFGEFWGSVLWHLGIILAHLGSMLGVFWLCWLQVGAS